MYMTAHYPGLVHEFQYKDQAKPVLRDKPPLFRLYCESIQSCTCFSHVSKTQSPNLELYTECIVHV